MKRLLNLTTFLFFILGLQGIIFAQNSSNSLQLMDGKLTGISITYPTGYTLSTPLLNGYHAPAKTLGGANMKILVVFAWFTNDNTDASNNDWPVGQLPSWASNFIGTDVSQAPFSENTISNYFYKMSNGQNIILGHIYPSLVRLNIPNDGDVDAANLQVLQEVDKNLDFAEFDKWDMTTEYSQIYNSADGYVDAVYIIYRNINVTWGGYGILGTYYHTVDGTIVCSHAPTIGMIINAGKAGNYKYENLLGVLSHEYGHSLFGYGHNFEPTWAGRGEKQRGLGLMPTSWGTTALNPQEKYLLGYTTYTDITSPQSISLPDFQTTGIACRIPLKYTRPNPALPDSIVDEAFVIANHQKLSIYDKVPTPGIYIYHVKNNYYSENHIKMLPADGFWKWKVTDWKPRPLGLGSSADWYDVHGRSAAPSDLLPVVVHDAVDRIHGRSDLQEAVLAQYPLDGNMYWWEKWIDENGNAVQDAIPSPGDAFNIGYNQTFNKWSNPATVMQSGSFSNTSMYISSYSNGIFDLQFYTDTVSAITNLPPSKPQDLEAEYDTLNRTVISWTPNLEPDVVTYKIYKATAPAEPANDLYQLVATISQPSGPLPARLSWTDPQYNYGDNSYKAFYRVEAVDNQSPALASLKSDYAAIDYLYYLPNSIAANLTLNGHVYANRDFTVESGVTLTIKPGTVITFFSNSSLIVNGVLLAKGTAAKKIIIDFISISFSPINRILASSGSNIDIRNAEVKNSAVGLWTTSSFVYVDSCDFHNMYKPFYLINNSYKGRIKNSYIRNSSSEAMWLNCSHLELFNNKIYNNNGEGVRTINYTDVDLSRNTIENNSVGINVATYSLARLMGYNLFRNSSWNSLYAKFNGVIEAGEGYNTFNPITGNYIRAEYNGYVYADWNYWGQPAPDPAKFYVEAGSLIDTSNYLPAEPGAGSTLLKYGKQTDLRLAFSNLMNGEYDDAEKLFRKVVKEKFNENESKLALSGLASCYRRSGKDGFKKYLNDEIKPAIKNKKDDFYRQYLELYTYCLTQDGSYDEAIDNLRAIRDNYKLEIEQKKELDFQEAFINLAYKDNSGKAQTIFEKMRNDYPDKDTKFAIDGLLSAYKMGAFEAIKNGTLKRGKAGSPDFEGKHNGNIPRSYELFPNYPNPFNPATTISFAIPVQARVELKIFDITGNEIKVFTFNSLDAGYHNLQWDGRNSVGESMPSGIYIYKLRTVSYEDGKLYEKASKMMLLK